LNRALWAIAALKQGTRKKGSRGKLQSIGIEGESVPSCETTAKGLVTWLLNRIDNFSISQKKKQITSQRERAETFAEDEVSRKVTRATSGKKKGLKGVRAFAKDRHKQVIEVPGNNRGEVGLRRTP